MPTKKTRGRPKADRTREKPMQIRLTAEEHAAFSEAASNAGFDLSNWVRMILRKASGL